MYCLYYMVNTNVDESDLYGGLTMGKSSTNSITVTHCSVVEPVLTCFQYSAYHNTIHCIFAILNILIYFTSVSVYLFIVIFM